MNGIHFDQHGVLCGPDGKPLSPERRAAKGLDGRVLQPGGMPWLRVETGKAVRR